MCGSDLLPRVARQSISRFISQSISRSARSRPRPVRSSRSSPAGVPGVGMDSQRKRTYTVTEVARELGISRSTAYECVRTGEIPCLRFGRRIVVAAAVIDQLLSAPASSTVPADELGTKSINQATASAASRSSDGATWK